MTINTEERKAKLRNRYVKLAPDYDTDRYGDARGSFYLTQTDHMMFALLKKVGFEQVDKLQILDVATGTGRNLIWLKKTGAQKIYGLDYVLPMLQRAIAKEKSIKNSVVQGDAESLPFKSEQFDLIISNRFFHLIPRKMQVNCLKQFAKALKPDGLMIVEFLNPAYFLNPRSFIKTIIKWCLHRETRAITTWPFFWKAKYPFLTVRAIAGTWLSGIDRLIIQNPQKAHQFDSWLTKFPLNLMSERLLVAFSVNPYFLGDKKSNTLPRKSNLSMSGGENSTEKIIVKYAIVHNLRRIILFWKDKHILKKLQSGGKYFIVPQLRNCDLLRYVTVFHAAIPVNDRSFLNSNETRANFFQALQELQRQIQTIDAFHLEAADNFLTRLDLLKRLIQLYWRKTITGKELFSIVQLDWMRRESTFLSGFHGDLLSGGNISLDEQARKFMFLDFENSRRNEFFLSDLVHLICKRPTINIFEESWVCQWIREYIEDRHLHWNKDLRGQFVDELRRSFCLALLRRLSGLAQIVGSDDDEFQCVKSNLLFCMHRHKFLAWITTNIF